MAWVLRAGGVVHDHTAWALGSDRAVHGEEHGERCMVHPGAAVT